MQNCKKQGRWRVPSISLHQVLRPNWWLHVITTKVDALEHRNKFLNPFAMGLCHHKKGTLRYCPNLVRSLMRKTKLHKDPRHKRSCLFYPPYFGTEAVEHNFVTCTCTARCGSKQITLAAKNNLTKPIIHCAISKTTVLPKHKNEIIAAGKKKRKEKKKVETPRINWMLD